MSDSKGVIIQVWCFNVIIVECLMKMIIAIEEGKIPDVRRGNDKSFPMKGIKI